MAIERRGLLTRILVSTLISCFPAAADDATCGRLRTKTLGKFLLAYQSSKPAEADVRRVLRETRTDTGKALSSFKASLNCTSFRRAWPAAIIALGAVTVDIETEDFLIGYFSRSQTALTEGKNLTSTLPHEVMHWDVQAKLVVPLALATMSRRRTGLPDRPLAGGQESPQADRALDVLTRIGSDRGQALEYVAASGLKGDECTAQSLALRLAAVQALSLVGQVRGSEISGRLQEIRKNASDSPSIQAETARLSERFRER